MHEHKEEQHEREQQEDKERRERYQVTGQTISHAIVAEWLNNLAEGKDTPCPVSDKELTR